MLSWKHRIKRIIYNANQGTWNGKDVTSYFENCRHHFDQPRHTLIFTRDEGAHTSGWKKNPDFERCYHLSLSFKSGSEKKLEMKYLQSLFGKNYKLLWIEPPYSKFGRQLDIWHYRLFCDENWQAIKPKGEPYDTENTPRGWKSFSEVHGN